MFITSETERYVHERYLHDMQMRECQEARNGRHAVVVRTRRVGDVRQGTGRHIGDVMKDMWKRKWKG